MVILIMTLGTSTPAIFTFGGVGPSDGKLPVPRTFEFDKGRTGGQPRPTLYGSHILQLSRR